ncbi:MAG: hypothetical protein PUG60_12200 [Lachnospiraceae bacterium]|nr:hypothetical protein [Lachnospiraceae bacterium]MDY4969161.1 hypothetical protein [Lachnospiraceae bacterium]
MAGLSDVHEISGCEKRNYRLNDCEDAYEKQVCEVYKRKRNVDKADLDEVRGG